MLKNLFSLFKSKTATGKEGTEDKAILLWEDNYLTIEIMSFENLTYATKEIDCIAKFGDEHFDGAGFTEIYEVKNKPVPTKELNIPLSEIVELLASVGLSRYPKVMYYGAGETVEVKDSKTIVYGELDSGIFIEHNNEIVQHIWFDSFNWQELFKTKIKEGLQALGDKYNLILVDWSNCLIIDLRTESEVEKYLKVDN